MYDIMSSVKVVSRFYNYFANFEEQQSVSMYSEHELVITPVILNI